MENIAIFKKGEKIHITGLGSRCFTKLIADSDLALLRLVVRFGYARFGNDAPRGGRTGDYYEILKTFTPCDIALKLAASAKEREERLLSLPTMAPVDSFETYSDIGSIIVNGEMFGNFKGDGTNAVEIYNVNLFAWDLCSEICPEQIMGKQRVVRKFDKPQELRIAAYDCEPDGEMIVIKNVIGFAVVYGKIKVFKVNTTSPDGSVAK